MKRNAIARICTKKREQEVSADSRRARDVVNLKAAAEQKDDGGQAEDDPNVVQYVRGVGLHKQNHPRSGLIVVSAGETVNAIA
jgi:hypothetical protein